MQTSAVATHTHTYIDAHTLCMHIYTHRYIHRLYYMHVLYIKLNTCTFSLILNSVMYAVGRLWHRSKLLSHGWHFSPYITGLLLITPLIVWRLLHPSVEAAQSDTFRFRNTRVAFRPCECMSPYTCMCAYTSLSCIIALSRCCRVHAIFHSVSDPLKTFI